jgi:hypothetical protein
MTLSDAQQRAQSELQSGESLYWTGTADPRRAALMAFPASLFGIPFAGFALFWISSAYHATSAMSRSSSNSFTRGFAIFPLFGLPFLLIGLGVILTPLWVYLKGLSTVYAVTNQRVMIITGGDVLIRTTAQTRTNNSVSQVTLGLFGVSNVKEVARQVMNLHTQQRPAA